MSLKIHNRACAYIDPWMIHELCDGHPLRRLSLKEGPNQLFSYKHNYLHHYKKRKGNKKETPYLKGQVSVTLAFKTTKQ